jgi:hypothetical protein
MRTTSVIDRGAKTKISFAGMLSSIDGEVNNLILSDETSHEYKLVH